VPGLHPPESPESWTQLFSRVGDSLRTADPVADAHAALDTGDCHLLGVIGYSLIVPGLPERRQWEKWRHPIYYFPWTNDALTSAAKAYYQSAAHAYATRYNNEVLGRASCREAATRRSG
jgi:hypothetical protein